MHAGQYEKYSQKGVHLLVIVRKFICTSILLKVISNSYCDHYWHNYNWRPHSHSKKWLTLHALTCWHIICLPGDGRCILLTLNFISMIRTAYQRVHPCRPWQLCPPTFMCIIPLMFSKLFMVFSLYRNICCMNLICIMYKVNYCVKNE